MRENSYEVVPLEWEGNRHEEEKCTRIVKVRPQTHSTIYRTRGASSLL